jgi:hypothetical protein
VTGAGVVLALGGAIAAVCLFPGAHRSCALPAAALDSARANAFASSCVDHGLGFVVAVAVLALGGFVIVNGVALSVRSLRQRPLPRYADEPAPPREAPDAEPTDGWQDEPSPVTAGLSAEQSPDRARPVLGPAWVREDRAIDWLVPPG